MPVSGEIKLADANVWLARWPRWDAGKGAFSERFPAPLRGARLWCRQTGVVPLPLRGNAIRAAVLVH